MAKERYCYNLEILRHLDRFPVPVFFSSLPISLTPFYAFSNLIAFSLYKKVLENLYRAFSYF